tara:strand:- start:1159 stop:1989 length:831 start_codon:yes stop_codon:yes gene_type:complete
MKQIPNISIGIKEIKIVSNLQIRRIPEYLVPPETSIPTAPPVTLQIGTPLIDLPGCVEYNPANNDSENLVDQDERGNVILCDGTMPSFNPINYEPERIVPTRPALVPAIPSRKEEKTEEKEEKETESTDSDFSGLTEAADLSTANIICPPREAPVVGSLVDGGKKTISGYEIQNQRCVTLYEEVPVINQVVAALPSAGAVTTTTSIAVVATTSAVLAKPLADLVLKVIKPVVKTLLKKIAKIRGKKEKVLSFRERLLSQRERNRTVMELQRALGKK